MSNKKQNAKELFKDHVAETIEYDPEVDGGKGYRARKKATEQKKTIKEKKHEERKVSSQTNSTKQDAKELFKDYVPETIEYDPEVDGSEEHLIRDELLEQKKVLKDVITKLKEKNRGDRKVRR